MNTDDVAASEVLQPDESVEAGVESTQVPETPATPDVAVESTPEPDYRSLYEESERRRAGLDRKLSRLSRERNTKGVEEYSTGNQEIDDSVYEHPLTQKSLSMLADYQLKDGVREILTDFSHVPAEIRKAIEANPRGFVTTNAKTVDDGLEDIENFLLDTYGVGSVKESTKPKEFPAAKTNANVADNDREKSLEEMDSDELNESLDRGDISLEDLEHEIKKHGQGKGVKKLK